MNKAPGIITSAVISAAVLCSLLITAASGQTTARDQVKNEITRNEELLHDAHRLVSETNSVKARALLKTSITIQNQAKQMFMMAQDNIMSGKMDIGRLQMMKARDLAFAARQSILRTLALAKKETMTEAACIKTIERAQHRLEKANDLMREEGGRESMAVGKFVDESAAQLERSKNNLREHMYESALRLARLSESLSLKAIKILKREIRADDEVARALEKTDRVLEIIEERGLRDSRNQIKRLYDQAVSLQTKARSDLERGRLRMALELTRKSRKAALHALKLLSNEAGDLNVEQALLLTNDLLERAKEIASQDSRSRLSDAIETAEDLQTRAEKDFDSKRLKNALRLTRRARQIVKQALESMQRPLRTADVEAALKNTDSFLERVRMSDNLRDESTAMELLHKAEQYEKTAWEDFTSSSLRSALAHTKLARNLAKKALELLSNENL